MPGGLYLSRRRRWLWALPVLVLLTLTIPPGCRELKRMAVWGVVCAPNYRKAISAADDDGPDAWQALGVDRQLRLDVGPPDASLSVWIIEPKPGAGLPPAEPRGTILLLHGIHGRKEHMLGTGKLLADHGFRSVLVDLRGQGRSSGDWFTYGLQESKDLSQVLDALAARGLLGGIVGAYGTSYGGATALMLAGRDNRVEAVVTVAAFSDMREVVARNTRRYLLAGPLLPDSWVNDVIEQAGQLAGFNPDDASPLAAVARTKARLLIIHGTADAKIPCDQAKVLHAAVRDHSRLILIDGEDHDSIMSDRSGTLFREVPAWFAEQGVGSPSRSSP